MTAEDRTHTRPWIVGVVGIAIGLAYALRVLIPADMNPSIFIALGEDSPTQTDYARHLLGEVVVRDALGHDGKYFFAQANDPWYLEPAVHAAVLDRPSYRAQRMFYPMLAGGFGLLPPAGVVWSMLGVNLIALGVGTYLMARLAAAWSASSWLGLAFPLNLGLISELDIGGAGIVALAFCVAGLLALERSEELTAALLLAGAALSREVMLIFAVGIVVLIGLRSHWFAWRLLVIPVTAVGTWYVYLRLRLTQVGGVGDTRELVVVPFSGIWQAIPHWLARPTHLAVMLVILGILAAFVLRGRWSRNSLVWGAFPFAGMAPFLSVHVWLEFFDIARAFSPVFLAYPVLLLTHRQVSQRVHVFD